MTVDEWVKKHVQYWEVLDIDQAVWAAWSTVRHSRDCGEPAPAGDPRWEKATEELARIILANADKARAARREQERRGEIIYTIWSCNGPDGIEYGSNIEEAGSTGWDPPGPHWTLIGVVGTEEEADRAMRHRP